MREKQRCSGLCDILRPDEGKSFWIGTRLIGWEPHTGAFGLSPQDFGFYPDFTAERFLFIYGSAEGAPVIEAKRKTAELLAMVGLEESKIRKSRLFQEEWYAVWESRRRC